MLTGKLCCAEELSFFNLSYNNHYYSEKAQVVRRFFPYVPAKVLLLASLPEFLSPAPTFGQEF